MGRPRKHQELDLTPGWAGRRPAEEGRPSDGGEAAGGRPPAVPARGMDAVIVSSGLSREINAMGTIAGILEALEPTMRARVWRWLGDRFAFQDAIEGGDVAVGGGAG